jgi:hypothetical protein
VSISDLSGTEQSRQRLSPQAVAARLQVIAHLLEALEVEATDYSVGLSAISTAKQNMIVAIAELMAVDRG